MYKDPLRDALIGPGDPEENAQMLGRFGWLDALITDHKNLLESDPDYRAKWEEEDPGAAWEALAETDALIRDVRAILATPDRAPAQIERKDAK